jgi:hypothetical protein
MSKNNIKPYSWDKVFKESSFSPLEIFTGQPHLTDKVRECQKISDFFNFFFDTPMLNIIIRATNERINIYKIKHPCVYKTVVEQLSIAELRSYFGLLLLFGVLNKRDVEISEIWSETSLHHCYLATATMSRDRFKVLSCCISFDDMATREERKKFDNKFYKFSEIFEKFRENIKDAYVPGFHLCIDETL